MNFVEHGATQEGGDKIPYFRFSEDAQNLFYEWWIKLEIEKLRVDDEPIILEHLSKYRSLMPSLALIFHLVEVADGKATGPVTQRATAMAVSWCEYLESHARRIYGLVGNITDQASSRLAKKLQKGALQDGFTVRDVYRKEWGLLTDKEVVKSACEELVDRGWLREEVIPSAPHQKGKTIFHITSVRSNRP